MVLYHIRRCIINNIARHIIYCRRVMRSGWTKRVDVESPPHRRGGFGYHNLCNVK